MPSVLKGDNASPHISTRLPTTSRLSTVRTYLAGYGVALGASGTTDAKHECASSFCVPAIVLSLHTCRKRNRLRFLAENQIWARLRSMDVQRFGIII